MRPVTVVIARVCGAQCKFWKSRSGWPSNSGSLRSPCLVVTGLHLSSQAKSCQMHQESRNLLVLPTRQHISTRMSAGGSISECSSVFCRVEAEVAHPGSTSVPFGSRGLRGFHIQRQGQLSAITFCSLFSLFAISISEPLGQAACAMTAEARHSLTGLLECSSVFCLGHAVKFILSVHLRR